MLPNRFSGPNRRNLPSSPAQVSVLRIGLPTSPHYANRQRFERIRFERTWAERHRDVVEVCHDGNQGFCIHGELRRVKHGRVRKVGAFLPGCAWLMGRHQTIRGEYTRSASELADRVSGKVPFVVRARTTLEE